MFRVQGLTQPLSAEVFSLPKDIKKTLTSLYLNRIKSGQLQILAI